MDSWYSTELGDGVAAFEPSRTIKTACLTYLLAHGEGTGAAVFSKMDLSTGIVTAYFTPQAASLAKQFGGVPCPKPDRAGRLSLLAGSALDWTRHFTQ